MTTETKTEPGARVLRDSISPLGVRLTTLEVVTHRFVLAEFNTHRVFSRNSASSRAIPFHKQLARVMSDPAIPVSFPAEQRGMQGGDELDDRERELAEIAWLKARDAAAGWAKLVSEDLKVHKSVANRIIEPFLWHTIVVTATDWDGFWRQRCDENAQPEIRVAAEAMKAAYDASEPELVRNGDWHTPFIQNDEDDAFWHDVWINGDPDFVGRSPLATKLRVSAARSARVSYLTHDGVRDVEKDLTLYRRLRERKDGDDSPIHWSPLEHVATPAISLGSDVLGNFTAWHQLRHLSRDAS